MYVPNKEMTEILPFYIVLTWSPGKAAWSESTQLFAVWPLVMSTLTYMGWLPAPSLHTALPFRRYRLMVAYASSNMSRSGSCSKRMCDLSRYSKKESIPAPARNPRFEYPAKKCIWSRFLPRPETVETHFRLWMFMTLPKRPVTLSRDCHSDSTARRAYDS